MSSTQNSLQYKFKDRELILGSASPRRSQLLAGLDLDFTVSAIGADESFDASQKVETVPVILAKRKSMAYNNLMPNQVLITADTVVILEGKIINKPADIGDAKRMLEKLSGNAHHVITGVCIRSAEKVIEFSEKSTVHFDLLEDHQIDYYLHQYPPLDRAGGYGIQDWIGYIGIHKIEGCFYNVMGLPVHKLYKELCVF